MSQFQSILLEREGGLARLVLNRPEHRNGMTSRMVRETYEALSEVARDESVRVLVLTGAGEHFCPGADLAWASSGEPRDSGDYADAEHFAVPTLLHEMPQLTVAAVNGACAGAAFGWACACDVRLAARRAMFNTAFLGVAVAGDMGVPWTLPRLVGAAKARELSFFSEKFSAEDALRMGLVARVYEDDEFAERVEADLTRWLERSPTALHFMKAHYNAAEHMRLGDYVALETERHRRIASGEHAIEAFKAFIEKRKPRFT